MTNIWIGIPTNREPCLRLSDWLLWAVVNPPPATNIGVHVHPCSEGPAEARNQIIAQFLAGDDDVLWFLDDDVVPPRHWNYVGQHGFLGVSVESHQPVMAGWYHQFDPVIGLIPCVYDRLNGHHIPKSLTELETCRNPSLVVDAVGAGCMLMPRYFLEQGRAFRFGNGYSEDLNFCFENLPDGVLLLPKLRCSHMKRVDLSAVASHAERMRA